MPTLGLLWNIVCITIFTIFTHPLILIMILITQTLSFFILNLFFNNSMWLSYILFLILVGGLLIIFIYLSALIPNEIFPNMAYAPNLMWILIIPIFLKNTPMMKNSSIEIPLEFSVFNSEKMIIWLLTYLFMTTITSMVLLSKMKTPLKQKMYD